MRHKRLSRRRMKRRFMRYQPIGLEDVYNHRLEKFVERVGYEWTSPRVLRRYIRPVRIVLEELSEANLRMAFLGDEHAKA